MGRTVPLEAETWVAAFSTTGKNKASANRFYKLLNITGIRWYTCSSGLPINPNMTFKIQVIFLLRFTAGTIVQIRACAYAFFAGRVLPVKVSVNISPVFSYHSAKGSASLTSRTLKTRRQAASERVFPRDCRPCPVAFFAGIFDTAFDPRVAKRLSLWLQSSPADSVFSFSES